MSRKHGLDLELFFCNRRMLSLSRKLPFPRDNEHDSDNITASPLLHQLLNGGVLGVRAATQLLGEIVLKLGLLQRFLLGLQVGLSSCVGGGGGGVWVIAIMELVIGSDEGSDFPSPPSSRPLPFRMLLSTRSSLEGRSASPLFRAVSIFARTN